MGNIVFYKENDGDVNDYIEISNGFGKSILIKLTDKKYSSFPIKIDKHISAIIIPYAMCNDNELNKISILKNIKLIIPINELNTLNEISFWNHKNTESTNEEKVIDIQALNNNDSINFYDFKITYFNVDYYNTFLIENNNKKYFYSGNYNFFNYKYNSIFKNKYIKNIDTLIIGMETKTSIYSNNDFNILKRLKSKFRKNKPICIFSSMFNIEHFINILQMCSSFKKYLVIDFYTYSIINTIFNQDKKLRKIFKKNKKIMKVLATDSQYDIIEESNFINFNKRAKFRQLQKSNKIIFKIENEEINKNINKYIFFINDNYIKDVEEYDINVDKADFIYYTQKNFSESSVNIKNFINKHNMLVSHIYVPDYINTIELNKLIKYTNSKIIY